MKILRKINLVPLLATALLSACGSDDAAKNFTLKGSNDTDLAVNAADYGLLGKILNPFAAAVDPTELKVKIYKFAVSESALCTDPVTIYENSSPEYVNFYDSPTIGSGDIADATYPCVMVQMSDILKFKPAEAIGSVCEVGTEYTMDVCRDGTEGNGLDGDVTCTGERGDEEENVVTLHLSTASTEVAGDTNVWERPTGNADSDHGLKLGASFEKSGTMTGIFIVNGDGKVVDESGDCGHNPPAFTFATQQ